MYRRVCGLYSCAVDIYLESQSKSNVSMKKKRKKMRKKKKKKQKKVRCECMYGTHAVGYSKKAHNDAVKVCSNGGMNSATETTAKNDNQNNSVIEQDRQLFVYFTAQCTLSNTHAHKHSFDFVVVVGNKNCVRQRWPHFRLIVKHCERRGSYSFRFYFFHFFIHFFLYLICPFFHPAKDRNFNAKPFYCLV